MNSAAARIGKNMMRFLSRTVWNKEIDALLPMPLDSALGYAIRSVQENQKEWNWMKHISSWSMTTILINWAKNINHQILLG
jgi:hypothetical protein